MFQLRKLIHEYPVLVLPTHRSYMDFLLVSYIFYHYDLPLPVIATAMGLKIYLLMTSSFDFLLQLPLIAKVEGHSLERMYLRQRCFDS